MTEALVSIITPCYNAGHLINETIESVQAQSYQNWEMLIVDDCSSDHSLQVVQKEAERDPRIRVISLKKNGGAAEARNAGFEAAGGEYIAFLDSDDLWHPEKLMRQVAFMQEQDCSFSFTNYRIMKEDGERTNTIVSGPEEITYHYLLKNTVIGTLTVMLNRNKIGPFRMTGVGNCTEDFALWLSILKEGHKAVRLNDVLAYYRKSSTSDSANKWKSARRTWNTYRHAQKINLLKTVWYFSHYSYHAYRKHAGG